MARHRLTETEIKALSTPGVYGDGDGLWLRVQKGGSRNWVFIYRRKDTGRTEIGLGGYGRGTAPVSLKRAREKANAIREKLAGGEDPRAAKPKVSTFAECMEAVLAKKESELANPKHVAQWGMTLRDYAKPLHSLSVATATVDDVVNCLTPHWTERPETARRLRARIAHVFDYAIARGLRQAGNPAQSTLISKLLSDQSKLGRGHHAALPYKAIPKAMAALRRASGVAARAVAFTCLTAARTGETRGATWGEVDFKSRLWIVPAQRMKADKEHRVPLSRGALALLKAQKKLATGDLIFGGDRDGKAISDTAMIKALRRASGDKTATLHGLRSSFRDWAGDETKHPREVAEAALAHVIGGVEAAYRRSDALAKRRALMDDWDAYCA